MLVLYIHIYLNIFSKVASLLINAKSNVLAITKNGLTPLHMAAQGLSGFKKFDFFSFNNIFTIAKTNRL